VIVHRGYVGAGARADLADSDLRKSALREQPRRGFDETLAGLEIFVLHG
jgi:hypothetical protein